jgi:hypothetical protein
MDSVGASSAPRKSRYTNLLGFTTPLAKYFQITPQSKDSESIGRQPCLAKRRYRAHGDCERLSASASAYAASRLLRQRMQPVVGRAILAI